MAKKNIVVLTDEQINLLLSTVFTEYIGSVDPTDNVIVTYSPDDARNMRMLNNIETALVNSIKV